MSFINNMLFNFVKPTFIEETQRSQKFESIASDYTLCSAAADLRILKFDTLNLLNDVSKY